MDRLNHEDIQQLLGAYAIDAVDGDEREAVELHLMECPRCRAEVAEHREAAAFLAHTGVNAPAGLWDRIVGTLEEAPPDLDLARITSLPAHRETRRVASRRLGAAAMAVAAAAAVALGVNSVEQSRHIDRLEHALEKNSVDRAAVLAASDPHARRADLKSPDGTRDVKAVVLPDGTGYILAGNLRPLPADRTYQLWAIVDGQRISAGVLGTEPRTMAFGVAPGVWGLAITEEKAGGVPISANDPVVSGRVAPQA
jgi:hypothetical protein